MVRSELLQKLCNLYPNILRKDIKKILEIIFHELTEALCRGDNIEIRGFGIFIFQDIGSTSVQGFSLIFTGNQSGCWPIYTIHLLETCQIKRGRHRCCD